MKHEDTHFLVLRNTDIPFLSFFVSSIDQQTFGRWHSTALPPFFLLHFLFSRLAILLTFHGNKSMYRRSGTSSAMCLDDPREGASMANLVQGYISADLHLSWAFRLM